MKKLSIFIIVAALVLSLCGCGKTNMSPDNEKEDISEIETQKTEESAAQTKGEPEWKQFLKDYEDWMMKYAEVMKKYKDNPADSSILSDYADMMKELADWQSRAETVKNELENASPSEVAEYSAELLKIAGKMAEAAK